MAYNVYRFDNCWLPQLAIERQQGPGESESAFMDSAGGVFNYFGTTRRLPRRSLVAISGEYIGEQAFEVDESGNFIVDESGNNIITHDYKTDLQVHLDALQSKIGVWGTLWRKRYSDDSEEWKSARLLTAAWPQSFEDVAIKASVQCLFETVHTGWHAGSQTTTNGTLINGLLGVPVRVGGNHPVRDATIALTASGGSISSVQIVCADRGIDLRYTGTIASGETVTINCDNQTVTDDDNTDQYSSFALGSGHTARGWCPLSVGLNLFVITADGPGTISFEYYDQWT